MKKTLLMMIVLALALVFSACGKNTDSDRPVAETENITAAAEASVSPEPSDTASPIGTPASSLDSGVSWPATLEDWGVPMFENATITNVEDISVDGAVVTQGVNFIVNLSGVTKQDFDDYCAAVEKQGFEKSPDSLADIMLVYSKAVSGGELKLTLSYDDSSVTLIANNSAAAAQKADQPVGSARWPESFSGIPEFTKGTYKETVEMGGGMYAITYTGVSEADVEWYRETLLNAGFVRQEQEDTEGYAKLDTDKAYSIGFIIIEDTLQLIAVSGSY